MIATIESTQTSFPENSQSPLPPSPRDLEVYEFVAVRSKTTREAAEAFGISQTRVRQVLTRVVEFLIKAVPGDNDEHSKEQKLAAAEGLAGLRLDFLYGQAMTMWRRSQTPSIQSPVALGKVCYLNQALRITMAAAKVPLRPPAIVETESDASASTSEGASAPAANEQPATTPPAGDCSENAMSSAAPEVNAVTPPVATSAAAPTYRTIDEIKAAARREFLRPAQTGSDESVSLPKRGEADAPGERLLNRRERRARRRRLQTAK